jgi:hypothetical protein
VHKQATQATELFKLGRFSIPARYVRGFVSIVLASVTLRVALVDPRVPNRYPSCIFHAITGFECPGCGSTRAIHDLLQGDLMSAVDLNVLTVIALPWMAWRYAVWALGRPSYRKPVDYRVIVAIGVMVTMYGALRNLPISPINQLSAAH